MAIYEYLCSHCNRVYSFFTRGFSEEREPVCPRCGATDLTKQVSRFAFVRSGGGAPGRSSDVGDAPGLDAAGEGGPDALDDPRVEREMMRLMQEAEHMDENDPRQMGRFMRRMSEVSGEALDPEMEEAVRRLEAGEDPEKIEDDMGDVLGGGPGSEFGDGPSYDEGLYPM